MWASSSRAVVAEALLALGGNTGDPRETIAHAIDHLCAADDVRLLARSSDYRTPPWGVIEQPDFINACIKVETTLSPDDLLTHGLAIEKIFGRDRAHEQRWGPRPLDIDLLAYDDVTMATERLTLPHPRIAARAFVLVPLAEIAPDQRIGTLTVRAALAALDQTGIEKLPPRG
jgi:2-amino-4-hydroxy-6-hydroxymethyldihydropteridine diphosphokinase